MISSACVIFVAQAENISSYLMSQLTANKTERTNYLGGQIITDNGKFVTTFTKKGKKVNIASTTI